MDTWAETAHLILDSDGVLWRVDRPGEDATWHRLGPVADADVTLALEGERSALLDLWLDGFDARGEQLGAYRLAVGAS